jgi:hypothetical protein
MVIQPSLLCSLDTFFAAAGIGLAGYPNDYKRRIILGFVACDTAATVGGALLPSEVRSLVAPLLLLAALIFALSVWKLPAMYMALPVLLSSDNFIAADHAAPLAALAVTTSIFSGLAVILGLSVGRSAVRIFSERAGKLVTLALFSLTVPN